MRGPHCNYPPISPVARLAEGRDRQSVCGCVTERKRQTDRD